VKQIRNNKEGGNREETEDENNEIRLKIYKE
jgi:hypothetical protein